MQNALEESRGTVPRDTVARELTDHQDADDVSTPVGCPTSTTGDGTTPSGAVEPEPRPLFEDISDAEDEPAQSATTPRQADVSPVAMFHSPVGSASRFDRVQSWASSVANDCSSSLPAASTVVASTCPQFCPAVAAAAPPASSAATGPAVPDAPFYPNLTSPPPPPLEDMVTAGILMPRAMTPLTIDTDFDTTLGPEFTDDFGDASHLGVDVMDTAQQRADDVTDTSHLGSAVTPDVVRSPQTATEHPPATSSVSLDETVTPSPPKIPRLRIVMGAAAAAGDASQSSTSPGSAASLPYVVTVDDALAPVDATEQSASSSQHDVSDDVTEPPTSALVESLSRQQRNKVKHSAAAKVRSVYPMLNISHFYHA